ncbi:hypothetical protein EV715DRAFT_189237 [Schizophyllum commune]
MASGTGPSSLGKHLRDSDQPDTPAPLAQSAPPAPPRTPATGRRIDTFLSTPLTLLNTSAAKHSAKTIHAPEARLNSRMDNTGYWVGPVPTEKFMGDFVQKTNVAAPNVEYRVDHVKNEKDLEDVVIRGVMQVATNSVVVDTSATVDRNASRGQQMKPDLMMYGYLIDLAKGRTQLDKGKLGAEIKKLLGIFNDDEKPGLFEPKVGQVSMADAVGQVVRYVEEMHARQHRIFALFLFISKDSFRIIRADRDRLIVTKSTPWSGPNAPTPNPLTEFLHRFDHLSEKHQGFDDTVRDVPPNDPNVARAREALAKYMPAEQSESTKERSEEPIRLMGVPCDEEEDGLRWFYIWKPSVIKTTGLRTRATRGYPAWDPRTKTVIFIKDAWRSNTKDALAEADVIRELNAAGVNYAPKLLCGGDLADQRTITDAYVSAEWNRGQRKVHHPRIHHRVAMNYGQPLWKFRSSQHLLQILHNVFTCHRQAVSRCRKLHRDFSAWNILWDEESGEGILTDWDLCAPMPPASASETDPTVNMMAQLPTSAGRPPDRTGTWAFMSTLSLNQRKLHDVQDDLESLFWVALFIIILYFPFDRQVALNIIDNVLQQHQFNQNGVPFGGDGKRSFVNSVDTSARAPNDPDRYHLAFTDTVSAPLLEWIEMYMGLIQDWIAYQDALKKWHKRQTQPAALQGGRAKADDGDESDEDDEYDEDEPVVDGVDDIGGDPKPQAPSLRDYRRLNQDWRSILKKAKKGLFMDKDRLSDELHDLDPEEVIAKYRDLVQDELQKETELVATASAQWHQQQQQQQLQQQQQQQLSAQRLSVDSDSEQDDTLPVVGPIDVSGTADGMREEEEAKRATKRQRTATNAFKRTSSPTAGQSGRISPGKGRD